MTNMNTMHATAVFTHCSKPLLGWSNIKDGATPRKAAEIYHIYDYLSIKSVKSMYI
jgi:hypothetical protein